VRLGTRLPNEIVCAGESEEKTGKSNLHGQNPKTTQPEKRKEGNEEGWKADPFSSREADTLFHIVKPTFTPGPSSQGPDKKRNQAIPEEQRSETGKVGGCLQAHRADPFLGKGD